MTKEFKIRNYLMHIYVNCIGAEKFDREILIGQMIEYQTDEDLISQVIEYQTVKILIA